MMALKLSLSRVVEPSKLRDYFPEILALSKREANPLGFIPSGGMETAIENRRLLALVDDATDRLAGYIFFGGVFPSAKVFQIAVNPDLRREGIGSSLLELLASHLEHFGYRSLVADIRDDLDGALAFYRANGFTQVSTREGGATRGRTILTHVKELDTEDLFSVFDRQDFLVSQIHELASRGEAKFSLDLNVYFDLTKRREHAGQAEELFRAALAGTIRVSVADEFVRELRKNSKANHCDPILNLALCIPKLPRVDEVELKEIRSKIHRLVFPHLLSPTPQSLSDCAHLAHAALARSTAFVTRDGTLLEASPLVLKEIGLEIVSPQELFALLPSELHGVAGELSGQGFRIQVCDVSDAKRFVSELGGRLNLYDPIIRLLETDHSIVRSVELGGRIEALAVASMPQQLGPRAEMAVVCRPENPSRRLFVDHLLDLLLRISSQTSPTAVRLQKIPGQSVVNEVARARGFIQPDATCFEKSVIGKPLHPANWTGVARALSARTGIKLPESSPLQERDRVSVEANGVMREIPLASVEALLGPTLIWWNSRSSVIVPIQKQYAEELLGVRANKAFDFIESRDAAFRTLRGYVSSPRSALRMEAGSLIFFYESKKNGGAGAVLAVAKIVSATVVKKDIVGKNEFEYLVVNDLDEFSSSAEILMTKFDNLFQLEYPVTLRELRRLGAADGANLVTAREIDATQSRSILEQGFTS
ncbi:GNAT family N-acetyltransferase [Pelagerythrobacter rhizovicinus]|uniref:GNAT family N-acetyltransferase n=1 Tax=Pelagerythrobacter rhizovicinus TaxID=2268576 RepID=A0A4Q2KPV3_9SPHN|nr:GNAT family N-acetyltransferase [Pelagerythrobacter rhizovicinus]RXZ66587.1 GNAT family N-acetyltransferase [Pelagerythrobacter rhizovicinus]